MIRAGDDYIDDAVKIPPFIVIDKSGSREPTLEHHLAMHLWMGWLCLYTLCIFPAIGVAVVIALVNYLCVPMLPTTLPIDIADVTAACNSTLAFLLGSDSGYSDSCYSPNSNFSSTFPIPNNMLGLGLSPPSATRMTMEIAYKTMAWVFTIVGSVTLFAIIVSVFAPLHKHGSPNPKWCISIGHWIMDRGAEYFKLKVVLEDFEAMKLSAESGRPAIFVLEPHDVLPVSIFSLCDYLQALPGKRRLIGCISSACFRVPLMRHVWSWVCAESVDRTNVVRLLNDGVSVCLCPGGVKEVIYMAQQQQRRHDRLLKGDNRKKIKGKEITVDSHSQEQSQSQGVSVSQVQGLGAGQGLECIVGTKDSSTGATSDAMTSLQGQDQDLLEQEECVLYLRGRKGFVRLALQHRCPLVPMFTFGQRAVLVPWFCTNR